MSERGGASSSRVLIGLMSGTSCDGVDAVAARLSGTPGAPDYAAEILAHEHRAYAATLRARLLTLESASLRELTLLHRDLADAFADATTTARNAAGLTRAEVRAVATVGHTACHLPPSDTDEGATLVLGDGDRLAERAGLGVLCELRARDRAAGGQGAPLVPFADACLLRDPDRVVVALNLGGIANLTWIPPTGDPLAFDTGPGNMLLDALLSARTDGAEPHDAGGAHALRGKPDEAWLSAARAADEFLATAPPKSTGRERYGATFLAAHPLDQLSLDGACATLAAYTVRAVVDALREHTPAPPARLIVSGGGAFNAALMEGLAAALPECEVADSATAIGVPVLAREALSMAILADASLLGQPANLPGVTGARRGVPLGKWCPGPSEAN